MSIINRFTFSNRVPHELWFKSWYGSRQWWRFDHRIDGGLCKTTLTISQLLGMSYSPIFHVHLEKVIQICTVWTCISAAIRKAVTVLSLFSFYIFVVQPVIQLHVTSWKFLNLIYLVGSRNLKDYFQISWCTASPSNDCCWRNNLKYFGNVIILADQNITVIMVRGWNYKQLFRNGKNRRGYQTIQIWNYHFTSLVFSL